MYSVLLLIWTCVLSDSHPFHISICEIEHDRENKTLQITSRLFLDDFEIALAREGKPDDFFKKTPKGETEQMLKQFFQKNLKVSIDSEREQSHLLGFEIENSVVWCYLEIEGISSIHDISVQYSVLLDTFNDQINLVHIKYGGKVKSLKFQKGQLTGTAAFTN